MTREQAADRARSACGHGTIYKLGQGGMKPHRSVPWDDEQECDCSGFAMWALGMSRFDAESGLWYDSSKIYAEAKAGSFLFTSYDWKSALPGDLLVYPDRTGTDGVRRHGHVGMVVAVEPGAGPFLMVDCSSGNFQRHSDAIREGPPDLFVTRGIVASYTRFAG